MRAKPSRKRKITTSQYGVSGSVRRCLPPRNTLSCSVETSHLDGGGVANTTVLANEDVLSTPEPTTTPDQGPSSAHQDTASVPQNAESDLSNTMPSIADLAQFGSGDIFDDGIHWGKVILSIEVKRVGSTIRLQNIRHAARTLSLYGDRGFFIVPQITAREVKVLFFSREGTVETRRLGDEAIKLARQMDERYVMEIPGSAAASDGNDGRY